MTELQTRFLAALRSGEYKQAEGHLRTENGFCCLGVMCDVFDSTRWLEQEKDNEQIFSYKPLEGTYNTINYLPAHVAREFGLYGDNPDIYIGNEYKQAAIFNDNGKSFAAIADGFEKLFRSMETAEDTSSLEIGSESLDL